MDTNLTKLNDSQLLKALEIVCHDELQACVSLLHFINEAEKRRLFIKQGYSSTFAYLTEVLKYFEGAVNLIHRILTKENQDKILSKVKGKKLREVQEIFVNQLVTGSKLS